MHSFFDQIIQKIFPSKISATQPLVREILQRSIKDKASYQIWLNTSMHQSMIRSIAKAYFYKKTNIRSDINIHLFQANGADGFAITYHPEFGKKHFQHLLDYFKDKVLDLNYQLQIADRQMTDKGNYVETIDKYYLKPNIKEEAMNAQKCNQQYGNILLEHISVDDQPSYIKVLVTSYSDYSFTKAMNFEDFVANLLETSQWK